MWGIGLVQNLLFLLLFLSFAFFSQISVDIKDAIVYLDAGSSESFQFLGAFPLFLELGARAVFSLENMSALDKVSHTVTIVTLYLQPISVRGVTL